MNKLLFILKRREDYSYTLHSSHIGLSTGLYNSASFVVDMLNKNGIPSKIEVVIDNNDIDRVVNAYKPTHVIIESLWVTPAKFAVLTKLHPKVQWIIRLHSEIPFLAGESVAMDWIADYNTFKNVTVACNSPRISEELDYYLDSIYGSNKRNTLFLPNVYPTKYVKKIPNKNDDYIDIGCFGAVRPLKNHLNQALAAIKYGDTIKKKVRFHINSGRIEMRGEPVMKNIMSLFAHVNKNGHELHNHKWTHRSEFLKLCGKMDIGMQVSFSETFNIVAADFVSQGVPIVVSDEIPWANGMFTANPTDTISIYRALYRAGILKPLNVFLHQHNLTNYTYDSTHDWLVYFFTGLHR